MEDGSRMVAETVKMALIRDNMKLKERIGSAYRIRTGDLVLERDAS